MLDHEKLAKLSPLARGRVNAALDKLYRFPNGTRTLRSELQRMAGSGDIEKTTCDGMIDYDRRKFNAMGSTKEQDAYIARLKARQYHFIGGLLVPKIVYDVFPER